MRKIVKRAACFILAFTCIFSLYGCRKEVKGKDMVKDLSAIAGGKILADVEIPKIPEKPENENLLTGEGNLSGEAIGKRPVAVMVNNVEPALPQYGIAQADVIFEIPVEGNLTRLMALYADYTTIPDICAIRSCRYYYPALAKGFDAFYIHWGSDQTILGYVNSLNIDRYDGLGNPHNMFARDSARRKAGYALEHTGYFKGTEFVKAIQADGKRTDLLAEKTGTAFQFTELGRPVTPEGNDCNKAFINFGPTTSAFLYDDSQKVYTKQMNGHAHIDGKTGESLNFKNVFILETSITTRDQVGHKSVDWKGSGSAVGYFISNGKVEKIHWSKANEGSYLRFYKENGEELKVNRGKSFIAFTNGNQTKFE